MASHSPFHPSSAADIITFLRFFQTNHLLSFEEIELNRSRTKLETTTCPLHAPFASYIMRAPLIDIFCAHLAAFIFFVRQSPIVQFVHLNQHPLIAFLVLVFSSVVTTRFDIVLCFRQNALLPLCQNQISLSKDWKPPDNEIISNFTFSILL